MSRSRNSQDRYRFRPCLEPLEDRTSPATVSMGSAVQAGSALVVNVASPGISTTLILQDGQGHVAVEWNGGSYQFFSGINNIQVFGQGFGNIIAVFSSGAQATPETLTLELAGLFNGLFYHLPTGGSTMTVNSNASVPFIAF